MIAAKEGYIAATSSISGKFGFPLRSAYAACKACIQDSLKHCVSDATLQRFGNIAYPGRIKTNIFAPRHRQNGRLME
jgi:NADP-dependent 3-hydroxy acid dehydrogenase YdfG